MKKLKKGIILLIVLTVIMYNAESLTAKAAESSLQQEEKDISYDMIKGGIQEFDVITAGGKKANITITEVPSVTKVADNTYQVKYDLKGSWLAGFNVKVSNNSFVNVSNPFCIVRLGYISNTKLILNSDKKATYSFNYHTGAATSYTGVRATISGTTLKVNIL